MIFLIGAIISSFSITLLIKYNESREQDRLVVLLFNYITATIYSLLLAATEGSFAFGFTTLVFGFVGGLIWPTSFFCSCGGIKKYGMSITGALARLSLSVPVLVALLFLGERFTLTIALGLCFTFAAFFLINPPRKDKLAGLDYRALFFFATLIVILGMSDFWMNMFKLNGIASERTMFLTLIFAVAGVIVAAAICYKKSRITVKAALLGVALGFPNYFSSFLLLEALKDPSFADQSAIVYSLYSASILVTTFTAGALLWKEKITRLNIIGAAAAIIAIVLLNISI
jgi:drug/metabolite transporter (DMT)-like permease